MKWLAAVALTGAGAAFGYRGQEPVPALAQLYELTVAPEHRCSPYDRGDYRYRQSVELAIVDEMGGRIYGPYTGRYFLTTRETDIEHIVATSEAHDSGLCRAPDAVRSQFATDLDNLTLAAPSVNRHSKSHHDAADWLPPYAANRCWFAARVVAVRHEYGLTIDLRERDVLEAILKDCKDTSMVLAAGEAGLDPSGTRSVCGPFPNCTELRRVHPNGVQRGHCAYARSHDRDNDGWACEGGT